MIPLRISIRVSHLRVESLNASISACPSAYRSTARAGKDSSINSR
jgi:hypothetical protein